MSLYHDGHADIPPRQLRDQPQIRWLQEGEVEARQHALYHRFRWPFRIAAVLGFALLAAGAGVVGWTLSSALTELRPSPAAVIPPPNAGR
jgi:hypothetical protein